MKRFSNFITDLEESVKKMSHGRLKFHMNNKHVPHGSFSFDQMKAERDRRLSNKKENEAYRSSKQSMSEAKKPDAVEVIRKKNQMSSISSSDKDKLSSIRAMLNKEKKR